MEFKPNINEVIKRYKVFWDFEEPDDRPVVQIRIPSNIECQDVCLGSSFEKVLNYYEKIFQERINLLDDTIPIISSFSYFGHAFMPSLLGTPLILSSGTTWSEPILERLEDSNGLRLNWQSDNFKKFKEFYHYFSRKNNNRFCLPQHLAKAPGELMSILRGSEKLIFDFYDQPDLSKKYGKKCLDISIEYSKRILKDVELTEIAQGHIYCYSNWVPNDTACFSEDFMANWSLNIYTEFIKPLDTEFIKAFKFSNMEWHSGCSHIFRGIPEIDAVEFNLDPVHPKITDTFDSLAPYIGKMRFLIPCRKDEVKTVIDTFGTRGLMLVTDCASVNEGNRLLEDIARWTHRK